MNNLNGQLNIIVLIGFLYLTTPTILYAETTMEQDQGENEYINNCAVCHGTEGKGDGPYVKQLINQPTDLTALSKNNGGTFPEFVVYQLIDGRRVSISNEGRIVEAFHGPEDMPIWGDEFRIVEGDEGAVDERINNLIEFLKTLQVK